MSNAQQLSVDSNRITVNTASWKIVPYGIILLPFKERIIFSRLGHEFTVKIGSDGLVSRNDVNDAITWLRSL
jgi:hypothetical protein